MAAVGIVDKEVADSIVLIIADAAGRSDCEYRRRGPRFSNEGPPGQVDVFAAAGAALFTYFLLGGEKRSGSRVPVRLSYGAR